jgi:hypothetical protein
MTQRKPPDLSFDSWIDVQIRDAKERGLFDELAGAGQPQRSLRDAEDPSWWAKQFLRREQVSYLPPAIEVRVRAQKLREVLPSLPSERAVREAVEALNADIRRVNRTASDGPPTTQAPLDAEDLVAAWRAARAGGAGARAESAAPARPEGAAAPLDSGEPDAPRDGHRGVREKVRRARIVRATRSG